MASLVEFYDSYNYEGDHETLNGMPLIYLPVSAKNILAGLSALIEDGIISPGQSFLDAGAGDGRVGAAAASLGLMAQGIELNVETFGMSVQRLKQAEANGVPTKNVTLNQGDFLAEKQIGGIPFEQIHIIYNYHNNWDGLSKRIAKESPKGTIFLYYTNQERQPELSSALKFVLGVEVNDKAAKGMIFEKGYLLAYRLD